MLTRHKTSRLFRWFPGALLALCWLALPSAFAAEETRLLRFPAIHGDQLVFSYAGDLFTVSARGGVARRLTSHVGYELSPRFSPDGRWLAFTGQYDGNTEVYLMPAGGGVPQRLTFTATIERDDVSDRMGPNNLVMTWRDDRSIVFRSRRIEWNDFKGQLYAVSIDGGMPEQLPLPRGGWCAYSPDRSKLAYNRVFREFRTWKRYRGGQADDIWLYDFAAKTTVNLTAHPAQDVFPMWHGDRIYFLSDRTGRFNLFVYDLTRKATRQLTEFTDFDLKFPSLGDTAIVFEYGGSIYRFDLATEKAQAVPIQIQEDFAPGRGGWKEVGKEVTSFDVAPDGNRAVFGAHGEVFTVPAKYGNTRNLTRTAGVHERHARWSPDGKWIAYVSDASGEDEIYLAPQDGSAAPTQLTTQADTYKFEIAWSPDSRKLLWGDKKLRLSFVDVASKQVTLVAQATEWELRDFAWSPDSQWIAYVQQGDNTLNRIYLYGLENRTTLPVTDPWFASEQPEFSADGKFLFFVSDRSFTPRHGQTEWNHAYFDMANLYLVTLARDVKSPFAPRSDEVKLKPDSPPDAAKEPVAGEKPAATTDAKKTDGDKADAKPEAKDAKPADKKVVVKVDAEGLTERIAALPTPPSGYDNLRAVADKLYFTRKGLKDEKAKLFVFDFEKQKETELGEFPEYRISADAKKMLVKSEDAYALIDLPTAKIEIKDKLNLGDLKVPLDRHAEWEQMYRECWRQMRDFFYAPNLHGVDWPAIRARYQPLLAHVNHRADLTYVIGEMIGELNAGHAYVGGGDYPKAPRVPTGLLGAELVRDPASGFYRVQRILKGQNWDKSLRSPLTEIGVDVRVGDYLVAIDGQPTDTLKNIYAALVNTAGRQVTLKVNREPKLDGSRETVVVPVADERPLYYLNWVEGNLERVARATEGKVGYVHIPNMGTDGLNEFVKRYYPQIDKQGLIVDVRGNGGGNVSPQIIERLRREAVMIGIGRNTAAHLDPSGMVLGPKVMLLDEFSASDGDIVAYRFKRHKLGPVIGKRSWGGVVGIRGSLPLLDGGYLNRPEFSRYDLEGRAWIMEGVGVEPDIVVDNDPAREFAGQDDQLERAIAEIQAELKRNPPKLAPPPPYPDKSK